MDREPEKTVKSYRFVISESEGKSLFHLIISLKLNH